MYLVYQKDSGDSCVSFVVTLFPEERKIIRPGASEQEAFQYLNRIFRYLLDAAEIVLVLRFVFKLLGANPGSAFVSFLYGISDPLVAPFRGIFQSTILEIGIAEWSSLVAMLTYALLAYLFIRLLRLFR